MAESLSDLKTRRDIANEIKSDMQTQKEFAEEHGYWAAKIFGITKDAAVLNDKILTKNKQGLQVTKDKAKSTMKTMRANQQIAGSIMNQLAFLKVFKNLAAGINLVLAANPFLAIAGVLTVLIASYLKLQSAVADTRKELGVSNWEATKLEAKFFSLGVLGREAGLSAQDMRDSFDAIRKNFGGIEQASSKFIYNLATAQLTVGATSEQIAKVLSLQESISDASRETLLAQMEAEAATIRLAGVAPGAVFQDIAENAEFFAGSMKDGGKNVFATATAARKLGLNLGAVEKIADGLLNFEDSIAKQMEASIILGKQLNLDKARQLSYLDDQEGMMREVLKQVGGEAEFSKMLRVERKVLADAIGGISVEELSRLVRNRETGGKMEAASAAMNSYEKAQKSTSEKSLNMLELIESNTKSAMRSLLE